MVVQSKEVVPPCLGIREDGIADGHGSQQTTAICTSAGRGEEDVPGCPSAAHVLMKAWAKGINQDNLEYRCRKKVAKFLQGT